MPGSPDRRVDGGEDADAFDAEPSGGEQDWKQSPGQAVVEVVDHAGLADGRQGFVAEAGQHEDFPVAQPGTVACTDGKVGGRFRRGMVVCFADGQHGEAQADGNERGAQQERSGTEPVRGGNISGGQGGAGDAEVTRGFVQSHGQAAPLRADEVHFHHDGGGPGQALADAKDDVGGHDPAQDGPKISINGTGTATSHPEIRTGLRP
ncbi:hypothetical protein AHiyo8_65800 [Arthrobacter sp. Hiyo8]|nr:hypothetical protein AHiyo8_65800 [Arthrobacter sp. Hiyo8]